MSTPGPEGTPVPPFAPATTDFATTEFATTPTAQFPALEEPQWAAYPHASSAPAPTHAPAPAHAPVPAPQPAPVWPAPAGAFPAPLTAPPPTAPRAPGVPTVPKRGPGWGSLFGVALVTALVAAVAGGVLGAGLVRSGVLDKVGGTRSGAPVPTAGAGASTRPQGSVASIAAKAMPSVVTIQVKGADGQGTGSGWVYDGQGHIVTNNHVVASAADSGTITVVLSNGSKIAGTIVGRDVSYDIAVLRVDRTDLTPLPLGDSDKVVVGDPVIAVGAPLGLASTVTTGIISALNRPVTPGSQDSQSFINALQTDAAINPGNSGGPLLDSSGAVVGVNSAIARVAGSGLDNGQSGNIGVGFAIPSNQVARTAEQLITKGTAVHPVIGVYLDRQYTGEGVRIADDESGRPAVNPGGPAAKAGLRAGDVILAFDGRPITDPDELVVAIRAKGVGDSVRLSIRRGTSEQEVTMVLQASQQ